MNKEDLILQELKGLKNCFDGLEGRFDGLEGRFDGLEGRFDGLEGRFDGLEKRLDDGFKAADEKFDFLATRLMTVEEKVDQCASKAEVRALEGRMMFMFDQQGVILQRLDQERIFNEQRIKRIEEKIGT